MTFRGGVELDSIMMLHSGSMTRYLTRGTVNIGRQVECERASCATHHKHYNGWTVYLELRMHIASVIQVPFE